MAGSHLRGRRSAVGLVVTAVIVAACGSSTPSVPPSTAPTPIVTPDPHLPSPATAQQVFTGLGKAGLRITPYTASFGPEGSEVVTKVFATYLGWPLDVIQFESPGALTEAIAWPAGAAPGRGEPPLTLAGGNILVTWGPAVSGARPGEPDELRAQGLRRLVSALDALLAPLRIRTSFPAAVRGAAAAASEAPSASAPP